MALGNALNTLPRFAALASLLVTLVGFVVIVAGLAELQKQTNHLGTIEQSNDATSVYQTYVQTYQSTLISPYPNDHHFQFAYIWFIIFGELFALLLTAIVLAVPAFHVGRGAALAFNAILCTLAITVVNNITFLHKNAAAVSTIYKKKYINVTYAGVLLVVLGNVLTILALGFWEPWRTLIGNNQYYGTNQAAYGTTSKTAAPATTGVATAETRV